jgi:carbamoyl-phosphate synthase large subunit
MEFILRILTEASGSLTSSYLIKAIQDSGHEAIASDVNEECAARYLADGFIQMPKSSDPELWEKVGSLLVEARIDLVIPSFDETLLGWAQSLHARNGYAVAQIILSPADVIDTFVDKWKAFEFFVQHGIPTPMTSLKQEFPLVKPRLGRGGKGVFVASERVDMSGCISQEMVLGEEYTVDVLCDNSSRPLYIVPRKRIGVRDGKSTQGVVVRNLSIERVVQDICAATRFRGPVNIQCFRDDEGGIKVIEVNPRIAGGMALGFAATENWVPLMVSMISGKEHFKPLPVKYGLKMMRYYAEVFA